MSKAMSVKVCHDDVKDEDSDYFGFSSTETKPDLKLELYSGNSQRLARPLSHNAEEKNVQHLVSSNDDLKDKPTLSPSADMDRKTMEDVDEALCIGISNLRRLHDADEMLRYLDLQMKQEGAKLAETADRAFDELISSLLSRKKKLHADLMKIIDSYSADIAKAKEVIEEKEKSLTGAIKIAKELKNTPSMGMYCDLPQVICHLKLPVDAELSSMNSLKERISLRFFLSTDEITTWLENLGSIEFGTRVEGNSQPALTLDDKEEMPDCSIQSSAENMFPTHSRESKKKSLANKLSVHEEVITTKVQKTLPMTHYQNVPALPKFPSTPDVIIEEIFEDEDNIETEFPPEHDADDQRNQLFKEEMRFQHKAGETELVFVSHVINPCHFYIRRYSQKKEAAILETKLKNFCVEKSSYLLPSDVLELGGRIFIKSKETRMWCRGTITEIIPLQSGKKRKPCHPVRYKVYDIALLEVFLIDFGSSIVLTSSGYVPAEKPEHASLQTIETDDVCLCIMKPDQHIEAEFAAIPPLALRCSLKNIAPKNAGEVWGEKAKTTFLEMVNNKVVSVTVFGEENGVLIVDLRAPSFSKQSNMPLSLKDALVCLGLARFSLPCPSQSENTILQYSPPKIPQEGEEVFVVVCHINNPNDFYLQLRDSLDSLNLPEKIQEAYQHVHGNDLEIVCPIQGQACVAKQEDGNWYRAQIIGMANREEVTVKYVDFGNIANLTLKHIRRIKEEFLSFPEKAIRCSLACIEPYEGSNEWNREAKERFEEMTEDKLMLCSVIEILDNNILSVELFDLTVVHGRSHSINCQLVKEGLASNIPGYTKNTVVRPKEIWDVPLEEIPKTSETLNPIDRESVDERDFKSLSKKEQQGRISHVVSPSKIFIQWLASEPILKSLQEKMSAIYRKSQPPSVKWERSMHCAVYLCDLKQWQRGLISRIVSETSAEVILYDSGAGITVDISCLRKLKDSIKRIKILTTECSLADIRPTGGSTQWTATVCEYLSYYLTGAQVKVIIQGTDADCALLVKILCKDETGQLIDISEHLIKKGLAFRNRRTDKAEKACLISKKHLEVPLEEQNTQLDGFNSKTACAGNSTAPKESITVSEREQKSCKTFKSLFHSGMDKVYNSLLIPRAKNFKAVVSFVGHDGTIHIIPKSIEIPLNKLMSEIQSNFKCCGVPEPYCWKKGEACIVRGSDTLWYRGKVVEVGDSTLQVQYIDRGCIKKVSPYHLYPTTLYTDTPPFCIPCELSKTVPIGNSWQQDAINCLQELLTNKEVDVHVEELPDNAGGKLSISLYFGGVSLSSFMACQMYCVSEDCPDTPKLKLLERDIDVSPSYLLPPLPVPGETFTVRITHLLTPKEVYICLDPSNKLMNRPATEGEASGGSKLESLDEALRWCNKTVKSLPVLTHFQAEMPCLVEYQDGLWYRAKILSGEELNPAGILVQFVDYGSFSVVPRSRLRHIPYHLLQYPVQAVRALVAGFKPASYDKNTARIPYSPEWTLEALWAMINCIEGKQLTASMLALSPDITISLYEDDKSLVHMKLVEMGLADLDG